MDTVSRQYRFGDFTLDLDGGFLRRGDQEVTVRAKAFEVLIYLVERHGRLVTKTELIEAIWPDSAVTDNSLAQCLLDIRRALGDSSQQMIRTVARRGYVFAAPVITPPLGFPRSSADLPEGPTALPEFARPSAPAGRWKAVAIALVVCAVVVGGMLALRSARRPARELTYTQLTDFTDSAVAPALSPDGRILAFIRGARLFGNTDQIYVKMLPGGEAIQLTHDPHCTGAGWSPDGRWMYLTVAVDEKHHLWRQRFPDGEPEQMTSGVTEEDGVAVAPDGSLVTSIGTERRAIWIHDRAGDRPLSSEGTVVNRIGSAALPSFSSDAKRVHYLRESAGSARELWSADVESGKSEPVLPGITMAEYDVSPDGKEVVFSTQPAGKPSQLWVAPMDHSAPPRQIASDGANAPRFGPAGQVLFRFTDDKFNYVGRMNKDGSGRAKVVPYPISTFLNISPDRRWLIAITPLFDAGKTSAWMAVPTAGGSPRPICANGRNCPCAWSPDGRLFYVSFELKSETSPGTTIALPVEPETGLPDLPAAGIQSVEEALAMPGSLIVEQSGIIPGPDPSTYAYIKTTAQRNLFRVRLQ